MARKKKPTTTSAFLITGILLIIASLISYFVEITPFINDAFSDTWGVGLGFFTIGLVLWARGIKLT